MKLFGLLDLKKEGKGRKEGEHENDSDLETCKKLLQKKKKVNNLSFMSTVDSTKSNGLFNSVKGNLT